MVSLGVWRSPEGPPPAPPPIMDPASSYNQLGIFFPLIPSWETVSETPCLQSQELLLSLTLNIIMAPLHHKALAPAFAPALKAAGLVQGS